MPDTPGTDAPEGDATSPSDTPKGYMVSLAVILIGILIVLVVFMNFFGQSATASSAITETPWQLQAFYNPDGSTVPALDGAGTNVTFTFDGKVKGYGGCNGFSGRYMVQETRIVVSQLTTTSIACRDNTTMHQEERMYLSLEDAAALRIHDKVLTLYGIDGKPVAGFVPARTGI